MSTALATQAPMGAISSVFASAPPAANDSLSAGIEAGFGLIGYRGKSWSIRYRGEERILMRDDGDGPRNSIEIIVLNSAAQIAKIWYENGYVDGANAAPDCYSTNGVVPAAGALKKQAATCVTCPRNAWGSARPNQDGTPGKGKACGDSRRLAVVPMGDITNEAFGGPLLLRVPAASLGDLANFGTQMSALGYPYYSIAIRVAFDPAQSFPKMVFTAIRPLSDDEARLVMKMRDLPAVARILAESHDQPAPAAIAPPAAASPFEQPPPVAVAPAPAPAPTPAPAAVAVPASIPASVLAVGAAVNAPAPAPAPVAPAPVASGGGFGPMSGAPVQHAAPAPAGAVAPAIADAFTPGSDFEREMDARLEALLPAAKAA